MVGRTNGCDNVGGESVRSTPWCSPPRSLRQAGYLRIGYPNGGNSFNLSQPLAQDVSPLGREMRRACVLPRACYKESYELAPR